MSLETDSYVKLIIKNFARQLTLTSVTRLKSISNTTKENLKQSSIHALFSLSVWIWRGKYTCMYLRSNCKNNCWYFTPIFVNLFVRWRHRLYASLRNRSCFDLWPYYLDFWPFDL